MSTKMSAVVRGNRDAIFGPLPADHTVGVPIRRRECKLLGINKRPIPGLLEITEANHRDLWVWTNQPKRAKQDVIGRVDLSQPNALDSLKDLGVDLARIVRFPRQG